MRPLLIVPGFHGSEDGHWQTWLQREIPGSRRVSAIDWEKPKLYRWADKILRELDESPVPVTIVAHSFGCLASAVAIALNPHKVASTIFVAPADPGRFSLTGPRNKDAEQSISLDPFIPNHYLGIFGVLVGSRNDPWMTFEQAQGWAQSWGLEFFDAGHAGHINVASGHGPWPLIKDFIRFNPLRAKIA